MGCMNNVLSCVSTTLVVADRVCDYVPFVSTVSNLVDLFEKSVLHCCCTSQSSDIDNRYFSHIKDKSKVRCVILLVPILGNIAVALYDSACFIGKCISSYFNNRYESQQIAGYDRQIDGLNRLIEEFSKEIVESQDLLWFQCVQSLIIIGFNSTTEGLQEVINPTANHSKIEEKSKRVAELANQLMELRRESYRKRLLTMSQEEVLGEARRYYLAYVPEQRTTMKARKDFENSVNAMGFEVILPKMRKCIADLHNEKSPYFAIEMEEIAIRIESIMNLSE